VNAKGNMKADIRCGPPFEPVYVHKMLQDIDYEAFKVCSATSSLGFAVYVEFLPP